jgi:hypothetical protein
MVGQAANPFKDGIDRIPKGEEQNAFCHDGYVVR